MAEKIGDWDSSRLVKFIQDVLRNNPPTQSLNMSIEKLTCTDLLTIQDQVQFNRSKTTVGAAGGATALPATPRGYVEILDPSGVVRLIPYFDNG